MSDMYPDDEDIDDYFDNDDDISDENMDYYVDNDEGGAENYIEDEKFDDEIEDYIDDDLADIDGDEYLPEEIDENLATADHPVMESEQFNGSQTQSKPQNLMDFAIDLDVQLGALVLNKEDALSMESGDILKLETSCPGEVSLVFQGREVGRGKLVDIDGYIGVQITHNWCRS